VQSIGGSAASHDASIRKFSEINNPLHLRRSPLIPALFLSLQKSEDCFLKTTVHSDRVSRQFDTVHGCSRSHDFPPDIFPFREKLGIFFGMRI
jgi:hypothetical protein